MIDYANIPGLDAPLGSVESRAAARLILELRKQNGSCGCLYSAGLVEGKAWVSDGPIRVCEQHRRKDSELGPICKLSSDEIGKDRAEIAKSLEGTDLIDKFLVVKRPF
jgi:hypothetical protein